MIKWFRRTGSVSLTTVLNNSVKLTEPVRRNHLIILLEKYGRYLNHFIPII